MYDFEDGHQFVKRENDGYYLLKKDPYNDSIEEVLSFDFHGFEITDTWACVNPDYYLYVREFIDYLYVSEGISIKSWNLNVLMGFLKINRKLMEVTEFQNTHNMKIDGDLDLDCAYIEKFPKNLMIFGNLYIRGACVQSPIPTDLRVTKRIYISVSSTIEFPPTLYNSITRTITR